MKHSRRKSKISTENNREISVAEKKLVEESINAIKASLRLSDYVFNIARPISECEMIHE